MGERMKRWPWYSPACRSAVDDLLRKGGSLSAYRANPLFPTWTGPAEGSYAYKLEREIERKFRVRHAVAVNSGTAALHAALASLSLKPGEEVVTSPYTFSATASAILLSGGTPVFADVDPYTFCITKETVKRVITKRTRAILPVHLFGGLADMRGLKSLGLPVIEDACQAVGARSSDGYSGTTGLAGAYSFNGGKNVPAGECGMLVTNDDKVSEAARRFMNHGENFKRKEIGYNYRPNELTCAVAYHGLLELDGRNVKRIQLAYWLAKDLHDQMPDGLHYNTNSFYGEHVYYVMPWKLFKGTNRGLFVKRMKKRGIYASAGYLTPPLHMFPAFKKYARGRLPVVEELSFKTLCLINDLTPDKPLSYARKVAEAMRESLK